MDQREKLPKPAAICLDLGAAAGLEAVSAPMVRPRGGGVVDADPRRIAGTAGGPGAFTYGAAKVLKGGGYALIKVFQGAGFQELVPDTCGRFAKVKLAKPAAARARRPEMYLLAKDFRLV